MVFLYTPLCEATLWLPFILGSVSNAMESHLRLLSTLASPCLILPEPANSASELVLVYLKVCAPMQSHVNSSQPCL